MSPTVHTTILLYQKFKGEDSGISLLGKFISPPWTNTWEIQKQGKEVPGIFPPLKKVWTMKYLAGIGSVKSPGDIISEQSWLPIKRLSESFQSNIHLFQSYGIIDGLGQVLVVDSINTEASLCLEHGAAKMSIAVMAFCSSHVLLHSLATLDGHSSCRVAFIFISEIFARKIALEDISIERLPSLEQALKG